MFTPSTPKCAAPGRETDKDGAVLFMVMGMLAAISVVGGAVYMVTRTDLAIAGNYKTGSEAFVSADAAVHYVKARIDADLSAGSLVLDSATEAVNYPPPVGYSFDPVTTLTRTADTNAYVFRITGRSMNSRAVVDAIIRRKPSLQFGLFGNTEVDMKAYANVYSYNSFLDPTPTPDESTGEGDSASNQSFITHMGTFIDGTLALGESVAGDPADWQSTGTPIITGGDGVPVNRIQPDPLGAVGGMLEGQFLAVGTTNDNLRALPPITPPQNRILLNNGQSMTLPSGNYYINSIILKNGASLVIDNSAGPVNIYLEGSMEAKVGSSINISGAPTDFNLYSRVNQDIIIKHNGTFKGLIYAPFAFVEVKNGGDSFGVVWAGEADIKNSGEFYIDTALLERRISESIYLLSWKEVRE